jgi:hypothetical protein
MDYIQSTTPTQRFSKASVQTLLPSKPEALHAELEYGCVDWYPYVTVIDTSTEWVDDDGGPAETAS